jgi:hypothetical protein
LSFKNILVQRIFILPLPTLFRDVFWGIIHLTLLLKFLNLFPNHVTKNTLKIISNKVHIHALEPMPRWGLSLTAPLPICVRHFPNVSSPLCRLFLSHRIVDSHSSMLQPPSDLPS